MNESNIPEWWSEQDQDEAWLAQLAQREKELERFYAEESSETPPEQLKLDFNL